MQTSLSIWHPRTLFKRAGVAIGGLFLSVATAGCDELLNFQDVTIGLPDSIDASLFRDIVVHDGGRVTLRDGAVPDDWGEYLGLEGGVAGIIGLTGKGIGEQCSPEADGQSDCRGGLRCDAGTCVIAGDSEVGEFCVVSAECTLGQCVSSTCAASGSGQVDDPCSSSKDCMPGLRCGTVGLKAICMADGQLDVGQECAHVNDCRAGLGCVIDGDGAKCSPTGVTDLAAGAWEGVACDGDEGDQISAYFELPETIVANSTDYFRQPFPSALRTDASGAIQLGNFPTPGVSPLVGVDPVAPYVARVNGQVGWSASSAAQFRFSGEVDFGSLGAPGAVQWVDITDPDKPIGAGLSYRFNPGRTAYICKNGLSLRRNDLDPMLPGHTYAVWLSTAVKSLLGGDVLRSPTLAALLSDTAPTDAALLVAHAKYASFRQYLASAKISANEVLNATVFTIAEPAAVMTSLAQDVARQPVPTAAAWVKCETGVVSPCPQAEETRACQSNALFDEYHTLIDLPIYQQGVPPYEVFGGDVQATPVRREAVCASLTVPKQQLGSALPLVIFAHGTGGSFRSHIQSGVSQSLANVDVDGQMVQFAVLGFDQVQHGPRRGTSTESPDNLFFNFLNPDASRGNPLQGALDLIGVVQFAHTLTTVNSPVEIDPARVSIFGHSQGSLHASLSLPFISGVEAAVLSGHGVSLMHALLTKTEPVDIASQVPLLVNDGIGIDPVTREPIGHLPGGTHHPVLSLIQRHIDPADGLAFARDLTASDATYPKHLFQTFGVDDHFSPPSTLGIFAGVARLAVARAHESAIPAYNLGPEWAAFPVNQTVVMGGSMFTAAVRQYGPALESDGHFVAFEVPDAVADVQRFLAQVALGLPPNVGR
jgi:hypothetical protein